MSIESVPATQQAGDTGVSSTSAASVIKAPIEPRIISCTVDFGTARSDMAKTTITGLSWVDERISRFSSPAVTRPDSDDSEDALLDQVRAAVCNIVRGVGFDVVAHAPEGTTGTYTVQIIGV